jgi:hypothetical protein
MANHAPEQESSMDYGAERAVAQYIDKIVSEARADERRKAALAFRNIRARLAEHDMPIHVAADIDQIICEDGGDFGDTEPSELESRGQCR